MGSRAVVDAQLLKRYIEGAAIAARTLSRNLPKVPRSAPLATGMSSAKTTQEQPFRQDEYLRRLGA